MFIDGLVHFRVSFRVLAAGNMIETRMLEAGSQIPGFQEKRLQILIADLIFQPHLLNHKLGIHPTFYIFRAKGGSPFEDGYQSAIFGLVIGSFADITAEGFDDFIPLPDYRADRGRTGVPARAAIGIGYESMKHKT